VRPTTIKLKPLFINNLQGFFYVVEVVVGLERIHSFIPLLSWQIDLYLYQ
tara:strand:+ start:244 stop:393 length:150 start_codon:yes stop_codon:yes gene_type:complete